MKILFLTRRFWPEVGGVEKHILEITKRLIELGHEVAVVAEGISPDLSTSQEFRQLADHRPRCFPLGGIKVHRIPITTGEKLKKFQIWSWLRKNRKLIQGADIVHAHDVGFWYWPFKLFSCKAGSSRRAGSGSAGRSAGKPFKPFYITFHGYEGAELPTFKAKLWHKVSEKLSLGNICIGDFHKKWYGTQPTFVSYGGVNQVRSLGADAKKKTTIFIGRLAKDTGILVYIKALANLKKQNINILLEVFGDGPLRREAEKLAKRFSLNVRFHGFKKGADKELADFRFAFVSRYLAILEAMVQKRLVFAVFDNEIKKDYLKMAPFAEWIIIERNPKGLVNKLKYFLDHPEEEKKLVGKAYNWASKQSWEKVTELYLKLWGK